MKTPRKNKKKLKGSVKQAYGSINVSTNAVDFKAPWMRRTGWVLIGLVTVLYFSATYSRYTKQLHENQLWFSHITQLEQEISFRTEAGLYYSYYKQLVECSSLYRGVFGLVRDNATESLESINLIQRFNIFQEILLAASYRILSLHDVVQPVYFHINSVFALQGVYVFALCCTAWWLSSGVLATGGALCFTFFFFNRAHATRVDYAIPLRESFALPFVALHILFTSVYLSESATLQEKWKQDVSLFLAFCSSLCVALFWQYAQFVFLLEGVALVLLCTAALVPTHKVWNLLLCHSAVLMLVCVLQFFNIMIIASLSFNLVLGASIVFAVQKFFAPESAVKLPLPLGIFLALFKMGATLVAVGILTILCMATLKGLLQVHEDDHIFKFALGKLGIVPYENSRDFDSLLYHCEPAFQSMSWESVLQLSTAMLLPCYLLTVCVSAGMMAVSIWRKTRESLVDNEEATVFNPEHDGVEECRSISPELAFNLVLSVLFGMNAMLVQRFKVLWVPHMCVLAAAGLAHVKTRKKIGEFLGTKNNTSMKILHTVTVFALIATVWIKEYPATQSELEELGEFYDPDTVGLMKWIDSKTPKHAVFAGSMQLLAGVKLCTGRTITNHPHYENKQLRERTFQVYQIYARRKPDDVYDILWSVGTEYIIVENSICYTTATQNCTLTNILDSVSSSEHQSSDHDTKHIPRFCQAVNHYHGRYFKLVFENPTFIVYKLVRS